MIQVSVMLFVFDLQIRQCRMTPVAPVDYVISAIDKAFLVKLNKHLAHGYGQSFIHGEAFPPPVTGSSQAF